MSVRVTGGVSRRSALWVVLALLALSSVGGSANGAEIDFGLDVRYFQFYALESHAAEDTGVDRDAERAALRLKLDADLGKRFRLELHGLAEGTSPRALGGGTGLAASGSRRFFDLEREHTANPGQSLRSEIDRLNLRWDGAHARVVVGRQAITWGVNFFWPVLDLFAPFAPDRIDRDYKTGVDAVRVTVPLGSFSELELVGAGQGQRTPDELSYGGLVRLHRGAIDYGFMAGSFHTDTVLGGFVSADVRGTGIRTEIAYTEIGDFEADLRRASFGRANFWRATLGVDRQLTPTITLTAETTWNGFGASDPARYSEVAQADRVRRGEITSLGRWYSGIALSVRPHPLLLVSANLLANWTDGSVLLQPSAGWSLTQSSDLLFGVIAGFGDHGPADGPPRSEYGAVPVTVWAAIKGYF